MNHYFSADLHLGHRRIIDYYNRPYSNHEEMDKDILERFNSRLRPGDQLYLLGDLCWSSFDLNPFLSALNTKEIFVIEGNHDVPKKWVGHPSVRWVKQLEGRSFGKDLNPYIVMCHYPLRTWNHKGRGAYHLYGHVHGKMPGIGRSMDVGVDVEGRFMPFSLEEIRERLDPIPFNKYD